MGVRRLIIQFLTLCWPLKPNLILTQNPNIEFYNLVNVRRVARTGSTTSTLILDESMYVWSK